MGTFSTIRGTGRKRGFWFPVLNNILFIVFIFGVIEEYLCNAH
jgi:hypothetical protein